MKIIRIGFVFGGFLSLILTLWAQTPRPPSKPVAKQPTTGAKAQPKYKGIWEAVNYTEDIGLNSVYFVSAQTGWVSGGNAGKGAGVILNTPGRWHALERSMGRSARQGKCTY